MGLGEIQNLYAKTLEAQTVFQQAVSQSELALRQTERRGIAEAQRNETMVDESTSLTSAQDLTVNLQNRAAPEKLKRYRLKRLQNGLEQPEIESIYPQSVRLVDLRA